MRFSRLSSILPILWLFGAIPCLVSLHLLLVPECRGAALANILNSTVYETEATLEEELLALTNQHRIHQGLKPLAIDSSLTQIARNHSYGMALQGFISHEQPSGDLETRMHRAGYIYEKARENVAKARTVPIAQRMLINSYKHRNNILADDVTRVGIGIIGYKPPNNMYIYITEIFAAPQREYPTPAVQKMATNQLAELRCQTGSISILPDPLFENLAKRSVSSLEIPVKREELRRLLADSAHELTRRGETEVSRLEVAVQLLRNPQNLKIPDQAGEKGAEMFGTAVRQVTDSKNQPAFLVLTLIGFTH